MEMQRRVMLSLIALAYISAVVCADGSETIESLSAFSSLRGCAQGCFDKWDAGGWQDNLAVKLNCPAIDSCVCRSDLQSVAQSYLSTCVSSGCSALGGYTVDLSSALALYSSYCAGEGYSAPHTAPTSVLATTTASPGSVTTTIIATSMPTSGVKPSSFSSKSFLLYSFGVSSLSARIEARTLTWRRRQFL
jgi:hypothetical protein